MFDIWRKEAINELESYEARKQALINIPDQIKELEEKITSIRSPSVDSVSVFGGGGSRDDALLNNIVARDMLKQNLEDARKSCSRVSGALNILTQEEREILERFYLKPEKKAAFNIAEQLNVDHKTVYSRKDAALKKFIIAMYNGI
jgi:DNA-binding CsgD family transcriptional regulator